MGRIIAAATTTLVLLLGAGLLSAGPGAAAGPGPSSGARTTSIGARPTASAVVGGRYVVPVQLDQGTVRVVPAASLRHPGISRAEAWQKMQANPTTMGSRAVALGYGRVTIASSAPGVPSVTRLAAWVGFTKAFAVASCPAQIVPPGSTIPPPKLPPLPSAGYAAFVIGVADGSPAVTYVARSAPCGTTVVPASLTRASEAYSLAWRALGPVADGSVTVQVTLPPCATFSAVSSDGSAQAMTITMAGVVPDTHGPCHGTQTVTKVVRLGPLPNPGAPPPVASAQTQLVHPAVGPLNLESPA